MIKDELFFNSDAIFVEKENNFNLYILLDF